MRQPASAPPISCENDLSQLLAGVGNHEAKAIVLGGMQPGAAYGATTLHRDLFLAPQGKPVAYTGSVSNQLDYCVQSFEPAGIAERVPADTIQYRITELGEKAGKALSGHALAMSLDAGDISLHSLFGMSKRGRGRSERPPITRLRIFRLLLGANDAQAADVQAATGISASSTVNNLRWLDTDGIIEYEGIAGKVIGDHVVYGLPERFTVESAAEGGSEMRRIVHETVGWLVADSVQECSMADFMKHLQERYPDAGFEKENRRKYARIMVDELVEAGTVTKGPFGGPRRSKITLREEARPVIERVVAIADGMLSGDPAFIEEGNALLAAILEHPANVRSLVKKAFQASPDANRVPREESCAHVRAILADGPLSSSEAIAQLRGYGLTASAAKRALELLRSQGRVASERIPRSRELSWNLVTSEAA